MTPVELLLSKLPSAKRQGKEWAARCPAHEDKRLSLSITEGEGGRALVHCHAGCSPEEITAALGMKLADLMPEAPTTARPMPRATRKPTAKAPARPPRTPEPGAKGANGDLLGKTDDSTGRECHKRQDVSLGANGADKGEEWGEV